VKTVSLLMTILPILAGQETAIPRKGGAEEAVYIVSRATTAESRALFSARLVKLNATKLYWYEDANVVRAQISPKDLETLRADSDAVLVLEADVGVDAGPPAPPPAGGPLQTGFVGQIPPQPVMAFSPGVPPPMPMGGMGMSAMGMMGGGGMGLAMGAVGLVDTLAGGVAQKMLYRPPSCKVSISSNTAKFGVDGGEGLIEINASGSCAWQAQTSVSWIKILSGSGVSGTGIIAYAIDPLDEAHGAASRILAGRSGAIWIAAAPAGSPIKGNVSQVVKQIK
jgi:hypothetical protein